MKKRTANATKTAAITPKAAYALKIVCGEHRLRILHMLRESPNSIIELEWLLGLRQPRISQELSLLRKGNLVHGKESNLFAAS
jgi:DNA-binding transcriptional ArsR family regulator